MRPLCHLGDLPSDHLSPVILTLKPMALCVVGHGGPYPWLSLDD